MIPLVAHFAAGVYGEKGADLLLPPGEIFSKARATGWSDDPDDSGGATMIDVTLATYTSYRRLKWRQAGCVEPFEAPGKAELRAMRFEEWREIMKSMYWDACQADRIESQGIANLVADWVWASGRGMIKRVQRAAGVKADGIFGPATLEAVNRASSSGLFSRLMEEREAYYRKCRGAWKYLRGWLRRLHAIREDGSFEIYGRRI